MNTPPRSVPQSKTCAKLLLGSVAFICGVSAFAQLPPGRILQTVNFVSFGSRLCVALTSRNVGDGINVEQGSCSDDTAIWHLIDLGNREVAVVNRATGKALDVSGASQDDGANVRGWSWNGTGAQRWRTEGSSSRTRLVNVNSGKCLDVSNSATHSGANIAQFRCHGGDNQRWQLRTVSSSPNRPWVGGEPLNPARPYPTMPNATGGGPIGRLVYAGMIVSRATSKCIDVEKALRNDGTNIRQWTCNGTPAQLWDFIEVARGETVIVSRASGKVMDVVGAQATNGSNIAQYTWNGGNNQRWRVEQAGRGFFRIVSVASNKCIDLDNAGGDDGVNVQQWDCHGRENQQWRIEVVGHGTGWRNYRPGGLGAESRYADSAPVFAIGTWRGYNPIYRSNVELTIHEAGDVEAIVDGSLRVNGYFRNGILFLGTERFEVARDGRGIRTNQVGQSSNVVRYSRR